MTRADEIASEFGNPAGASRPRVPGSDSASGSSEGHHGRRLELRSDVRELGAEGTIDTSRLTGEVTDTLDPESPEATSTSGDPAAHPNSHSRTEGADEVVHTPAVESLPQIARHAAGVWFKAAGWTAGTSLRVGNELYKLATDPNAAQEAIEEVTREVRDVARDFLGITELDAEVQQIAPLLSPGMLRSGGSSPAALRAQGEQLLREAADVGFDEGAHPAFARILTELSPDEARILRLLAIEGPQPMVDVRAHNLIGNGSQLIAQSLNMLGPKAGLRQRERVSVYLTNLVRTSLIVLSDDPLESPVQYQVLEAQPDVLASTHDTVRARVIRRSVLLTPLGQEFCEVCLPVSLPALPPPADR